MVVHVHGHVNHHVYINHVYIRYGFDFGCIHFVMMSGEHNFTIDSEQYKFLVSHLASVNRSVTPWLIFTGHRFVYTIHTYINLTLSFNYIFNHFCDRPMYVDSSQSLGNDSMQVVAKLLRESLESVLKVFYHFKWYM